MPKLQAMVSGARTMRPPGWRDRRGAPGRDHAMASGPELAPIGGVGPGQLAAALGTDRTAVDHDIPRPGFGACPTLRIGAAWTRRSRTVACRPST